MIGLVDERIMINDRLNQVLSTYIWEGWRRWNIESQQVSVLGSESDSGRSLVNKHLDVDMLRVAYWSKDTEFKSISNL